MPLPPSVCLAAHLVCFTLCLAWMATATKRIIIIHQSSVVGAQVDICLCTVSFSSAAIKGQHHTVPRRVSSTVDSIMNRVSHSVSMGWRINEGEDKERRCTGNRYSTSRSRQQRRWRRSERLIQFLFASVGVIAVVDGSTVSHSSKMMMIIILM